jgi:hypothetical protein
MHSAHSIYAGILFVRLKGVFEGVWGLNPVLFGKALSSLFSEKGPRTN